MGCNCTCFRTDMMGYADTMMNNMIGTHSLAPLYERVAGEMAGLIEQGTFRAGDRVPSIRQSSRRFDVSINTIMQAYNLLEDQRLIEARPQSGYYVRARALEIHEPDIPLRVALTPATVTISGLCQQVIRNMMNPDLLPLWSAIPHPN